MLPETKTIIQELELYGTPQKKKKYEYFFKTGKGDYGEGDVFIGVSMPDNRLVAKAAYPVGLDVILELLESPIHEARMCGALLLVMLFEKNKKQAEVQKEVVDFYLKHAPKFNNWDLVDVSCPKILGAWLVDKDPDILYQLAKSDNLWEQRISTVSTWMLIRKNIFEPTFKLAEMHLNHTHDLMHKACGWMLRELGKRDKFALEGFLVKHYQKMPRTMLRYSIEKFPESERQAYLKGLV